MPKKKKLTKCPKCGRNRVIMSTVECIRLATFKKMQDAKRILYLCLNPKCPQTFWYFPRDGKIVARKS